MGRVIVIGNCTIDLFFHVPRFPLEGETLLAARLVQDLGGKGANQAVVAARSGVPTVLVAPLGDDSDGIAARARLAAEPVDLAHLVTVAGPTDRSIVYVRKDGANCIVSSHEAARALDPRHVAPVLDGAGRCDVILLQGNLDRDLTAGCLAAAHRNGALAMLNPAPIHFAFDAMLSDVGLLVVNEIEALQLLNGGADDAVAAAVALRRRCAGPVVLTLGGYGAVLVDDAGTEHLPAVPAEVVDTTGAGDAVCGTLAAALARGLTVRDALTRALGAAAITVSRPGTQASFPTADEMRRLLEET